MVKLTTYNFLIFSLFLSIVVKTSESYSISERIKIVELYYANKCSASLTQKAYRKHFNVGTAPSSSTIRNMVKRFEERGSVKDLRRSGISRTGTSDENALLVRESLNENSQLSVRRRAKELCIPRTTLARIINQELYLFPYKMQVAQRIEAIDKAKRLEYVSKIKNLIEQDEHFIDKLIMSSEADFYLNGLIYKHNCKIWGMGDPRAVDRSEREGKKVTVWCGITSSRVIGPYFFENESGSQETVSAQNYRDMIQNYLMPELEDTKGIWFTQDEYPAHNDRKAINLLKTIFDNRLISMNSIVKWPGYSPDLLATDFFLWGYLKERVFESNPKTLEDLKSNIENAIDGIEKSTLKKVFQNVIERVRLCEQSNGGHLNDVIHNI